MKERIEENPRSLDKLARDSDLHRGPTFEMPIRRQNEQTSGHLRRASLAVQDKPFDVVENGDEKTMTKRGSK